MPRTPRGPKRSEAKPGITPLEGKRYWMDMFQGGYRLTTAAGNGDVVAYIAKATEQWNIPRDDLRLRMFTSTMEAALAFIQILEDTDGDALEVDHYWVLPYKGGRKVSNAPKGGDTIGVLQQDGDAWHITALDLALTGYPSEWDATAALIAILQKEGRLPVSEKQQDRMKLLEWRKSVGDEQGMGVTIPEEAEFDAPPAGGVPAFAE